MLSASGPTIGEVKRPSDGEHPKKIAFIQCVGSRDQEHEYCSSVCCMFANKQAMLTIDHVPDCEPDVFLMDMRAQGKGFDAFYQRAKDMGVSFIRSRPSYIKEDPLTNDLLISWEDEAGELHTEPLRHGRALGRPGACAQGAGGGRRTSASPSTGTASASCRSSTRWRRAARASSSSARSASPRTSPTRSPRPRPPRPR